MKKWLCLLLCLMLLAALPCSAAAAPVSTAPIADNANLLSLNEEQQLLDLAMALYREHDLWISIITVNSLGGKTAEAYADDFYDNYFYHAHPDGVLLLIAMDTREWAISTCGRGIDLLTDYELDQLFFAMSDELADDDFFEAFSTYLNTMPQYLAATVKKEPGFGDFLRILFVALLIGSAAGGITILVMRSQMNTATAQHSAGDYLIDGSYQLNKHHDIFLYSRVSKVRKAENNGTSTHRSSGGVRHGGRSGRF